MSVRCLFPEWAAWKGHQCPPWGHHGKAWLSLVKLRGWGRAAVGLVPGQNGYTFLFEVSIPSVS